MRRHMLHQEKRPAQIDCHDAVPGIDIDFGALCFLQRREQRRVVDQNVDLAEALYGSGDQCRHRAFVADIGHRAFHRIGSVVAGERRGDFAPVGDVGDHQARTLRRKRARIVLADAFGATGKDRNAAVETRHPVLCSSVRLSCYFFPPCCTMNLAKATSCCLMKPIACSSLIWPVFSSIFCDTVPMKISGLFIVSASRKIMLRRMSYCMRPPPRMPAEAEINAIGLSAKG